MCFYNTEHISMLEADVFIGKKSQPENLSAWFYSLAKDLNKKQRR